MPARLAALVAAIAMVVAAIFVRGRIDRASTTIRLTCATELEAACRAIGNGTKVTIEPAGVTADRLIALDNGADPGLDAWLAPGPWPQIVDSARAAGPLFTDPRGVAQTRIALVVRKAGRFGACQQWACVGKAMGDLGQKADIPDPAKEATGPLVLSAMTSGSPVDDPAVLGLLDSLRNADTRAADDATSILLTSPEKDAVASLDAVTQPIIATAANSGSVTVLYPQPVTNAEVVLGVTGSGKTATRARDVLGGTPARNALRGAGWNTDVSGAASTDPGVVAALRDAWKRQQ